MGIEPTTLAWEAKVLPLNYIRTAIPIALSIRNAIIISLFVTNVKQNYATALQSLRSRTVRLLEAT